MRGEATGNEGHPVFALFNFYVVTNIKAAHGNDTYHDINIAVNDFSWRKTMIQNFLRKLESQGWKQREIASKTGLSQNFISELSHGKKCSVDALLKFADAFGVSTDTVLGRKVEKTISPVEELLLKTTDGNEQIARAALRSAQGEKSLLNAEGEGEGIRRKTA